jgi:cell division protein FtsB
MKGLMVRIAVSVFGLATLAMLLLAAYDNHGYFAVNARSLQLKSIETATHDLEREIETLKEENKALERKDPGVIELYGRENLNMVNPGDVIITIPEDSTNDSTPAN